MSTAEIGRIHKYGRCPHTTLRGADWLGMASLSPIRTEVEGLGFQPVLQPSGAESIIDRFVLVGHYFTNLPAADGPKRVEVELLVDPDADQFWAAIPVVGVAATGKTPAEAALSAMRAAAALL